MRKFGMFFRVISGKILVIPGIRLPNIQAAFPDIGQNAASRGACGMPAQPPGRTRNQTVSNRSMTSVSATPARVHSWNAGNAVIASK